MWWDYQVDVPEGVSGDWRVEKFTVSEKDESFRRLRAVLNGHNRYGRAGDYTRLMYRGQLVMSDTHDEIMDHMTFIHHACGNVLINGLGLGVCLQAALRKEVVKKVTVIEISEDVIKLVGPHYQERFSNLEIICADAMTWQPPKNSHYDVVWHDIWPTICSDNLPEIHTLHRRYGRRCAWQGSWARELCEARR